MQRYRAVPAWLQTKEQMHEVSICAHIGYRAKQMWNVYSNDQTGRYYVACYRLGCNDRRIGNWTKQFEITEGIRVRPLATE